MTKIERFIDMLGYRATDKITKVTGVIESVSFDLYGCVQVVLRQEVDEKGELRSATWMDEKRLDVDRSFRVMEHSFLAEVPIHGPANKPFK